MPGLSLENMRDSVYRICGIDTGDMSTELVDGFLNRSWWEVMNKFKFRAKDTVADFALVEGSERYEVPDPFEALRSIAVYDINNTSHILERVTSKWYMDRYDSDEESRAFPTHYFREGTTINVWPTPDDDYNAILRYVTTLADLAVDNDPVIPQEWHEIIMLGGAWRVAIEMGDFQKATNVQKIQVGLINSCVPVESKEMADSSRANLEVIRNEYEL